MNRQPAQRFQLQDGAALDQATGLTWSLDANPAEWPLFWSEARAFMARLNRRGHLGFTDWRLPGRREIFSLIDYAQANPALPPGHPFGNLELAWYWTATTYAGNQAHAWCLHLEGGRMFPGDKGRSYYAWPVRGASRVLPATGSSDEPAIGRAWPAPRWQAKEGAVLDRLSGLLWTQRADLAPGPVNWFAAAGVVERLNQRRHAGRGDWRLPAIQELELLVDASRAFPALPADAPFGQVRPQYWSATTSGFDPDWAMALYLDKGGIGVGMKKGPHYHVWAVSEGG